jgi:hypothetical protein
MKLPATEFYEKTQHKNSLYDHMINHNILFGENVSIIIESKVEQKVMKHSAIDVEYI